MTGKSENIESSNKKISGWKKFRKIAFRTFVVLLAAIVILSLSFIILSQSSGFRHWFYGNVLNLINKELVGRIEADDIKISPFEGIKIVNLRVLAAGDTVAKIESLHVRYSFSPIFNNHLYIKSIEIIHPRIKLIRNKIDSTWNFAHIVKPSADTSPNKKLNWLFEIKNLTIRNADITIDDKTTISKGDNRFEAMHAHLQNFNLNLSAKADLKKEKIYAEVKKLKFDDDNSKFQLRQLGFIAEINKKQIELKNITLNTNFFLSDIYAKADNVNIFDGLDKNEIDNSDLTVNLKFKDLNLLFLNKIDKTLPQINDYVDLSAGLTGNIDNIRINQISLNKGNSYLHLKGFISKITKSDETKFDINVANSNVYDADLKKIKSAFQFDFTKLDRIYIKKLDVKGNYKNIILNTDVHTSSGDVSGIADINLISTPVYNSILNFSNLNIAAIVNNPSLLSNLNGEIQVNGVGLETKNINTSVKLNLHTSEFQTYNFEIVSVDLRLKPDKLILVDTLEMKLINSYYDTTNLGLSKVSKFKGNGFIDFSREYKPVYSFNFDLNEFNFASLLRTELAPQYLDTRMTISGKGFHPDSIETKFKAEINSCVFGNRALMPFDIELNIERFGKTGRMILLNSDLFNLQLIGEYQLNDFIQIADYQVKELVTFINKKVFTFYYNNPDSLNHYFQFSKIARMKPFTMDLTGEIKDLTPIGIAVGQPNLSGNANIEMYVDVENTHSIMDLRKLEVRSFQYKDGLANISINPTEIKAKVDMVIEDSLPVFKQIALDLNGKTESFINDLSFEKPTLKFDYQNEKLNLDISSDLNRLLRLDATGSMKFNDTSFDMLFEKVSISLGKDFKWTASEPVNLELKSAGLNIKKFNFKRQASEILSLTGLINPSLAKDVILEVQDFPISQASYFLSGPQKDYLINMKGKLQNFKLVLNDSLSNPRFHADFNTNNLYFYNRNTGIIFGTVNYDNQNLTANVKLKDSALQKELLTAVLTSLPIDLSIKAGGQRIIDSKKIDLSIRASNAPLNLVNPFLPTVITNMNGIADARLDITGVKNNLDYIGYIDARNASFLSTVNNIYYSASGNITINNENIKLNSIVVNNDKNDLRNSKAIVDGDLIFRYFNIEKFDLKVKSDAIKLLDMKSIKSMPDLYGDFVISSGQNPIHFYGTFSDPYLGGDLNIEKAKIYMPLVESKNQIPKSRFIYEIKGRKLIVEELKNDSLFSALLNNTYNNEDSSVTKRSETESSNFADLLNYDLNVLFVNPMEVNMEMPIGEVFAIVTTRIPNSPIHYYVNPKKNIKSIIGDLILKNNSTFKYIKLFNVTGDILFPTGEMNNPGISLKAEYNGKSSINGAIRNYTVNMYIKGSKNNPQMSFDYSINDEKVKGDSTKIREDALFLMVFGVTKTEFENPTSSGKMSPIDDLGAASIAAVLSKSVTEMLSGTGFITSADIDLQGGSFQNAKLKLSGQILGMTWNVGGTIADVMNGYEFTAEIPVGLLLLPNKLKSLFLLFTTSVNPTSYISRSQKNWEVKIKFGGEF